MIPTPRVGSVIRMNPCPAAFFFFFLRHRCCVLFASLYFQTEEREKRRGLRLCCVLGCNLVLVWEALRRRA